MLLLFSYRYSLLHRSRTTENSHVSVQSVVIANAVLSVCLFLQFLIRSSWQYLKVAWKFLVSCFNKGFCVSCTFSISTF